MTEEYQVTLPKLGESICSATIVQWFKKEGERSRGTLAPLESLASFSIDARRNYYSKDAALIVLVEAISARYVKTG